MKTKQEHPKLTAVREALQGRNVSHIARETGLCPMGLARLKRGEGVMNGDSILYLIDWLAEQANQDAARLQMNNETEE